MVPGTGDEFVVGFVIIYSMSKGIDRGGIRSSQPMANLNTRT